MIVRCVQSFVGTWPITGEKRSIGMNDVFELPPGTDWLNAGLVEPIEKQPETAARAKPKRRTTRRKQGEFNT